MTVFTSAKPIALSADWKSTMRVEYRPPRVGGLGCFSVFRSSTPEAMPAGLNASSSSLVDADCGGCGTDATPSEGAKRRYPAHFLSKLTDADGELQETFHWISSAAACGYLNEAEAKQLNEHAAIVGRLLGSTINNYQSFCIP